MAGEGKSKRKQEDEEGSRCSENGEQREKEKSGEKKQKLWRGEISKTQVREIRARVAKTLEVH